jgi:4,5-dihydroxyphthalate decarboxylase
MDEGGSMSRLKLNVAMWDYDRVRAIMDGRVEVEGCDVNVVTMAPEECFHRAWYNQEFDVCEIGFSAYVISVSRGEAPYKAIPVFPSRSFRHSCIYVRSDRSINTPADLRGKNIGVPEYQLAAPMWARGLLQDQYGVKAADINWFQGGMEAPGRAEKFRMNLPEGFPLQTIADNQTLNALLEDGTLDGIIAPRTPRAYFTKAAPVRRLFEDFESAEKNYFRDTGIFPIMHAIGIRNNIFEENPWLAASLLKAFRAAKAIALDDLLQTAALKISLPWSVQAAQEARSLMGDDWWPYGVAESRKTLEAMVRYSFEQGLSVRPVKVEELFVPSTLSEAKI